MCLQDIAQIFANSDTLGSGSSPDGCTKKPVIINRNHGFSSCVFFYKHHRMT